MQRTGRRMPGPGADLVELVGEGGLKHTAIVFATIYRDHACLNGELQASLGFMEQPEVTGLSRLVSHDPEGGAFAYPTGTVWSVAEIVRELAEIGETGGVKAGLELCYLVGEILVEASDTGAHSGLVGHGSIDPWKLMVKPDGQVAIIGYGLPRPEIEVFVENESRLPSEDGLRYCAPENLAPERVHDLSSDLFSLTLVALELMTGRPVYDGLAGEIRVQASRGEAVRRLYQWRDRIPEPVRDVIGKALKPDPDIRFRDGLDFVYGVHDLLSGIDAGDGPSLREVVNSVRARQTRGRAAVGGKTGSLTREELAALAADIDGEGQATDLPVPRRPRPPDDEGGGEQPRWRRASRRGAAEAPAAEARGAAPETRGAARARSADPAAPPAPRTRTEPPAPSRSRTEPTDDAASARERLLRRLRDRDDSAPRRRRPADAEDASPAPAPEPERRRRRPLDDSTTASTAGAPAPTEGEPAPPVAPRPVPQRAATIPAMDAPQVPPPSPAPVEVAPEAPRARVGGRAAALLERLRSSSGGQPAEPARRRGMVEPNASPSHEPSNGVSPAGPAPQPVEVAPQPAAPRPVEVSPPRVEAAPPRVEAAPPRPVDPQEDATAAIDLSQRPASPVGPARVGYAGRFAQVERSGDASAVASRAVESLELPLTDTLGARTAWYALCHDGLPVDPGAPAAGLTGELTLRRVPNQVVVATVELDGGPVRVKVPVSTAVPLSLLRRSLRELLGVDGAFTVSMGGRALPDRGALAELWPEGPPSDPVLEVRR